MVKIAVLHLSASLRDWKSWESIERKMLADLKNTPPSKPGTATLMAWKLFEEVKRKLSGFLTVLNHFFWEQAFSIY